MTLLVVENIPSVDDDYQITTSEAQAESSKIADIVHPDYECMINDWHLWRCTYQGGQKFIDSYLHQFSTREAVDIYHLRKKITPIPAFAKAAINDIKNAIFQRTVDITRQGGPATYQKACLGQLGGVDLASGTMNWFVGTKIIAELLTMKKVGVFVDMPTLIGPTVADKGNQHPYYYVYKAEDIRSWSCFPNGEYSSILLRCHNPIVDPLTYTSSGIAITYKLFYINTAKTVSYQTYDAKSNLLVEGILNISKIPFHVFEISDSLLNDVARHQIALLNLESSDIVYTLLANVPFYVEQVDSLQSSSHLRNAQVDPNDPNCPLPNQGEDSITVGTVHGRRYGKGLLPPEFINPSTDPLKASMSKQGALKEDIRLLVNLALSNVKATMASAESKAMDQHGLESGLSYIGLELEHGERKLAQIWSLYEGSSDIATIIYPKRYSLKSDAERQAEAARLAIALYQIPSLTYQKEILKQIVIIMVGDKIATSILNTILAEIDNATVIVADPAIIINDLTAGILDKETAAAARFYPKGIIAKANAEHAARVAQIVVSQSQGAAAAAGSSPPNPNPQLNNPTARGVPDLNQSVP